MINLEPHHRSIRNKANAIHFGLAPLALLVPVLWIYLSYGVCQEAESPFMVRICMLSQFIPLLPGLVGSVLLGFIVWELVQLGIKHHEQTHGVKVRKPHLSHAVHGYRAIDNRHRRHIHFAVAQVALVSLGLVIWLIVETYRSTH